MTKVYPDTTLETELNKRKVQWKCLWEIKAPRTCGFAWLVGYLVEARVVIVQTYRDGNGWQAYLPSEINKTTECVDDLVARCTLKEIA